MKNLFKRKPKQMSFDTFVENAQKIVPIEYTVYSEFKAVRYDHIPYDKQETLYKSIIKK